MTTESFAKMLNYPFHLSPRGLMAHFAIQNSDYYQIFLVISWLLAAIGIPHPIHWMLPDGEWLKLNTEVAH